MKKQLAVLAVVAVALAMTREPAAFAVAGAALLVIVAGGYERRTHF